MGECLKWARLLLRRRFCHAFCPLVGNELTYVASKVCGSRTKTGVNTRLPESLFDDFVYKTSLLIKPTCPGIQIEIVLRQGRGWTLKRARMH